MPALKMSDLLRVLKVQSDPWRKHMNDRDISTPGETSSAPSERWSHSERKYGHVFGGPLRDGYATCKLCGAHENERAIIQACTGNPLAR